MSKSTEKTLPTILDIVESWAKSKHWWVHKNGEYINISTSKKRDWITFELSGRITYSHPIETFPFQHVKLSPADPKFFEKLEKLVRHEPILR